MDFTLEVEDKIIRYAVSHRLYRPLFNPPNKVWRDSKHNQTTTLTLQIGDFLRYTNDGHNEMVDIMDINKNYPKSIN